jgi:uncharacterized protein YeeX (DUF496 family)
MFDLMEPNTRRVNTMNSELNDLEKQLKRANLGTYVFYFIEIQELQAFLFKGKKSKQSTLDDIYIKIAEIEKDRKMEQANVMFEISKFSNFFN